MIYFLIATIEYAGGRQEKIKINLPSTPTFDVITILKNNGFRHFKLIKWTPYTVDKVITSQTRLKDHLKQISRS